MVRDYGDRQTDGQNAGIWDNAESELAELGFGINDGETCQYSTSCESGSLCVRRVVIRGV